jgi:hypothetical protein
VVREVAHVHAVQVLAVGQDWLQQRRALLAAHSLHAEAGAAACGRSRGAPRLCSSSRGWLRTAWWWDAHSE